jgi:hypothetical protein
LRPDARRGGARTRDARHVELEREGIEATPDLVEATLDLPRVPPQLVETSTELGDAPLDLGQGLDRLAVRALDLCLDLGLEPLDRLVDPEEIRPETIDVLAQERGGFGNAPREDQETGGDDHRPPPSGALHRRAGYCLTRKCARRFFVQQPSLRSVHTGRSSP